MKQSSVIIWVVVLVVVLFSVLSIYNYMQPKPFNWSENYLARAKDPYGTFVFYRQISQFFPGKKVEEANSNIFEKYGRELVSPDTLSEATEAETFNFVAVDGFLRITELDATRLLAHVRSGNHLLLATTSIPPNLSSRMDVQTRMIFPDGHMQTMAEQEERPVHNEEKYKVKILDGKWIQLKPTYSLTVIDEYPEEAEIIATNKEGDVLGVRYPLGKGTVIHLTFPMIFTNYCILKVDETPSEKLMNTLPNRDTYYANGRWSWMREYKDSPSLLSFIHKHESLTWALYTLLFSVLLFFFFELKRQQKPIPTRKPPENVSLKFTEALSQLYLLRKDHKEMVRKKMKFFMEHVRNDLLLDTQNIDEVLYERLSAKKGVDLKTTKQLFSVYFALKDKHDVSQEDFLRFNRLIQAFKKRKYERRSKS